MPFSSYLHFFLIFSKIHSFELFCNHIYHFLIHSVVALVDVCSLTYSFLCQFLKIYKRLSYIQAVRTVSSLNFVPSFDVIIFISILLSLGKKLN